MANVSGDKGNGHGSTDFSMDGVEERDRRDIKRKEIEERSDRGRRFILRDNLFDPERYVCFEEQEGAPDEVSDCDACVLSTVRA